MFRSRFRTFVLLSLTTILSLTLPWAGGVQPARAAGVIVVDSADDTVGNDGACTLREAITNANDAATYPDCAAGSGADVITFAADYTITLGSQLPAVTSQITITGNGASNTIVQADAAPNVATYRVFEVSAAGNLTLDGLTVRHGRCNGACATNTTDGGGILNIGGTVTVTNSALSGNSADDGGGGIYSDNYSTVTVTNSALSNNSAGYGGGIYSNNYSTVTVTNSALSGNSATYSSGGGIFNYYQSTLTVTNSTLSGNSATYSNGGGIHNAYSGTLTVTNSTLSGNSANNFGGGIYNNLLATMNYSNTIIANSAAGGDCFNGGTIGANVNNLVENGSCSPTFSGDPNLGPLQDNGGPTQTHALLAGSAAIDAGNAAVCAAAPVNNLDQRGVARPQGAACDIGAYEYVDITPPVVMSITRANTNPTNAASVDFTVTFSESVTGVDAGDFELTTSGVTGASITSVSGSGAAYTVTVNTGTGNGTIRLDVSASSDIKDLANNALSGLPYASGEEYTIDKTAPTVTSILRADANPTNAASVNFTVTFSEAVTGVDAGDFDLTTTGVTGASVASVSGSGAAYTVTVNTGTGNGTIRLDVSASSDIKDLANNALSGLPYTSGQEYTVDKNPTVTSILRADPNPTNALSVDFSVIFSEDVVNVDTDDFDLTTTGVPGASVSGISGSGNAYTVTVDAVSGDGTIRLDVSASSDIKDSSGNDLDGLPYEDGEVYTVDKTPPTVTSIWLADANPTNAASVNFTVTFSEAVTGVDAGDFDLTTTGVTGASVASVSGSGAAYTVTVNTGTGNGTIRLDVSASSDIKDSSGNGLDGLPYEGGEIYAVVKFNHCYVDINANGLNNGSSWDDAYSDLQSALAENACTEIWVAAGTYYPTSGNDRAISFELKSGVEIYGGFAGTETQRSGRDVDANATILSGDIGTQGDKGDNSYHVVYANNVNNTAVLDGFTVTGGNANGGWSNNNGGGMYNNNSSPTLTNVAFSANSANSGGGMYNNAGSSTLTDVAFSANSADDYGGGMFNSNGSPELTGVSFNNNSSPRGGGMYNDSSSPTLTDVTFSGNAATFGGGMFNLKSSPSLTKVTFSGNNTTAAGGGMYNWDNSSPELTNVTFSDNSASYGGGMVNSASSSTLTNVLLANSTGSNCANDDGGSINSSSRHNLIDDNTCGLTDGVNGNKIGPGYNANLGPLANNGGFTQTHALLAGSAAIDAGDDAACPATDQRGVARPQGAHCDIGAYKYVDNDAPTVVSTTRANANPTSALSADFTVTFSEDVTGVDQSDFTLTKTGNLSGFSVASVTPVDARTYTVAVTVGSGNGSLRLDVSAASDIKDLNNNLLLNLPYIDGETYTVRRRLFVRSAGAQDGWTLESFETSNAGGTFNSTAITLLLGDDAVNRQYRSILSFNTASLPDNAVITKVTLKVRLQKIVGGGNPVNALQGFMADVRKGVFGTSALQVIDFQAPASKTVGPLKPALVGGWYTLNLTPAKASVNKLATGSGLTQIRLRFKLDDNNNAVANYLSLYSGNAAVGARPQLIVEYYVP
jgi:CSLREA domain-containing protein